MIFQKENNALIARRGGETLRIEAWGKDAFRVRAWMDDNRCPCDWALTETPATVSCETRTGEESTRDGEHLPCAEIVNGRLRATVNFTGVVSFFRDDRLILREFFRFYGGSGIKFSFKHGDGLAVYKEQVVAFGVALHEGFLDGRGAARLVLVP